MQQLKLGDMETDKNGSELSAAWQSLMTTSFCRHDEGISVEPASVCGRNSQTCQPWFSYFQPADLFQHTHSHP